MVVAFGVGLLVGFLVFTSGGAPSSAVAACRIAEDMPPDLDERLPSRDEPTLYRLAALPSLGLAAAKADDRYSKLADFARQMRNAQTRVNYSAATQALDDFRKECSDLGL